jgi:hypothetical protein
LIDDDRAIALSTAPGPIIEANDSYFANGRWRHKMQRPKQGSG